MKQPLHVFVDNSNIFGGVQRACRSIEPHISPPAVRLYIRNFISLIEGTKEIQTRVYAGSVPPGNDDLWQYSKDRGYDTNLLRKVQSDTGNLIEQGVDELIHLKIANCLLDADNPECLILATGDGQVSDFGTGFLLQAERALKRRWDVVVWSWREQLSSRYANLARDYPSQLSVNELDPFYYSITYVKAGVYTWDGQSVNVAERVVHTLPDGLRVY